MRSIRNWRTRRFRSAIWICAGCCCRGTPTIPGWCCRRGRDGLRDLHDLNETDGITALAEIRRCSQALVDLSRPDKMPDKLNVAALGNQVPQLHIHVIARFTTDPAWPGPVWGKVPAVPYEAAARDALIARLREALGQAG